MTDTQRLEHVFTVQQRIAQVARERPHEVFTSLNHYLDKVLQRAVVMLREPIYEQDFKCFSYGFRPGRSAHEALSCIWSQSTTNRIAWILDVDVRKYFDTLKQACLGGLLDLRVRDGVLRRLIGKWLHAGVLDRGQLSYPEEGTPQGGVISPLLANLYLHCVLDCWYVESVKPCMKGRTFLVRYADDFILGFENQEDADKVYRVLFQRFEKYGLSLHAEKTRLVPFGRPENPTEPPKADRPSAGTFDFLGFTHYWGQSREGRWVIRRKTSPKRLGRSLKRVSQWCRANLHEPLRVQVEALGRKLKGHFGYFGITGNSRALRRYRLEVIRIWRKWLARRGDPKGMPWERMNRLLAFFYLPEARVVHSIYAAKP